LNVVAQNSDKGTAAALKAIVNHLLERSKPALTNMVGSPDKQADEFLAEAFSALQGPLALARKQGATAAVLANALAIGTSRLP
jgi:hypothetical protein